MARLTLIVKAHYQTAHREAAATAGCGASRILQGEQEERSLLLMVGEQWKDLDAREDAAMLILHNIEGTLPLQVLPTPEERLAVAQRIVEVSVKGVPFALLRPGFAIALEPIDAGAFSLRCLNGEARIRAVLVPEEEGDASE